MQNREIKFRVWDKVNYMAYFKLTDVNATIQFASDCPLMQYTGLKDMNNVEIYEGDILKCTDGGGEIVKLNSDTGIGAVEFLTNWGLWYVGEGINNGLADLMQDGYVEVIGNIFETPHLLNKELGVQGSDTTEA
jgi:uncharacterized phage protein (TIGR01671 family)